MKLHVWVADLSANLLAGSRSVAEVANPLDREPDGQSLNDLDGYMTLPLHYANEPVGSLIIAHQSRIEMEVAQAVRIIAELILRQAADIEQLIDQQWALNRFLYDLLLAQFQEKPDAVVLQEAKLLEIDLSTPRVVAAVDVGPFLDHLQRGTAFPTPNIHGYRRQRHQLQRFLLQQAAEIITAGEENVYGFLDERLLVVLMAISPTYTFDTQWRQRIQSLIQHLVNELSSEAKVSVTAGIGDYYDGWRALPYSYHDAKLSLTLGRALYGSGKTFALADLGLAAFVCTNNPQTSTHLANRLLRPLCDNPELIETLKIFLEANLSPSLAAKQMGIHRHTLTYRLAKVNELTGLNPQEFLAAAQFHAALIQQKALSSFLS